jgi:dCMP deaminase
MAAKMEIKTESPVDMIERVNQIINEHGNTERVNWEKYFMSLALLTSSRSPCHRLHVGCVLVRNNRIISTGYNGWLAGLEHESVLRLDALGKPHEMATIHAEQNAICYGANTGISLNEATAYITHYPCLQCAKLLAACGVKKIYYHTDYNNDELVPVVCPILEIIKI